MITSRPEDYIKKFANSIERSVNMNSEAIKKMTPTEFKHLLKNEFFARKRYRGQQTEPTQKQLNVLGRHYGLKVERRPQTTTTRVSRGYYTNRATGNRVYTQTIKYNKNGRAYDGKTGRFIKIK